MPAIHGMLTFAPVQSIGNSGDLAVALSGRPGAIGAVDVFGFALCAILRGHILWRARWRCDGCALSLIRRSAERTARGGGIGMRALVIGASGGIGSALARSLAPRGEVVALSRSVDGLDVTEEASVARVLGALTGVFDWVFIASGALGVPEKSLKAVSAQAMLEQFALNAVGPALVIKHVVRLLPKDRAARVGVLSARVGSIGDNALGGWYAYRAAKAALNQIVHTAAIELARSHPLAVLACLHPGTVATAFTAEYPGQKDAADLTAARLIAVLEGLTPAQSGEFYDYAGKVVPW